MNKQAMAEQSCFGKTEGFAGGRSCLLEGPQATIKEKQSADTDCSLFIGA